MPRPDYLLQRITALWRLEKIPSSELPQFAWIALEANYDGRALRQLAALERPSCFQIGSLFEEAIKETELETMSPADAALFLAKEIAHEVLSGKREPIDGAEAIFALGYSSNFPKPIKAFGGLDQEFDIPQILAQCKVLVSTAR